MASFQNPQFGRGFMPQRGWTAQSSIGRAPEMPGRGGAPSIMGRNAMMGPGPSSRQPYTPGRNRPVSEIMSERTGAPNARYQDGSPVPVGMPIYSQGWNTGGMRQGGRIGSAAGPLGSGGVPTSQRGRAEKYGADPSTGEGLWQLPTWQVSEMMRENGGLSQSDRFGNMGRPPEIRPQGGWGFGSGPVQSTNNGSTQQALPPTQIAPGVYPTGSQPGSMMPPQTLFNNGMNPAPVNSFGLHDGSDAAYYRRKNRTP